MIIAVDGPLASGKGTIARALATRFSLPYLDTGSLYRATGIAVLDAGIDPADTAACATIARALDIGGIDEARIRTAEAGAMASRVASIPEVRKALFDLQRAFATQPGGAILDGRDIGTVICPDADVKLYVTADTETRATRRWHELVARGETITLDEMLAQTRERDRRDAERDDAPMRPADDATLLDTSSLSIDAAVADAVAIVEKRQKA
ncbi:MAG: cytidylate kinase [Maricaulis maris]|jgi:cytidylate kinase|uniref:Cytidylate kinase n=1 Tax=Maricaulis maris (strain MCS10) TaxID=394221 RepID=Q0ATJ2_MARMM|nr:MULTISPECIES: (d)CMP kinase [Maricaulis]ABI64395.1 cytidylate kinase [Maricaulis maris MCS10]MAC89531.1 (d)CMP kinase [Maricaulis sp.]